MFRNFFHLSTPSRCSCRVDYELEQWKKDWKFIKNSLKKKFSARLGLVCELRARCDADEDLFDVHVEENIILNSTTTWPPIIPFRSYSTIPTASKPATQNSQIFTFFSSYLSSNLTPMFHCECETLKHNFEFYIFARHDIPLCFAPPSHVSCRHLLHDVPVWGDTKHQNKIFSVVSNYIFSFCAFQIFREMNEWMSTKHFVTPRNSARKILRLENLLCEFVCLFMSQHISFTWVVSQSHKKIIFSRFTSKCCVWFGRGEARGGWGWI